MIKLIYGKEMSETNFAKPYKRGVETSGVVATLGSPPSK